MLLSRLEMSLCLAFQHHVLTTYPAEDEDVLREAWIPTSCVSISLLMN